MKRAIIPLSFLLLLFAALPLFAASRTIMIVDDVIRMSRAGVGDDEIIAFVHKSAEPFHINGDDIIAMNDAHVSRVVIKAVIDESSARTNDRWSRNDRRDDGRRYDDDGRAYDDRETVYVAPRVYVGSPYLYDPFYYGYYDPFFFGPRLSVGFAFGPRFFGGFREPFFRGPFRGGFHHGSRHH